MLTKPYQKVYTKHSPSEIDCSDILMFERMGIETYQNENNDSEMAFIKLALVLASLSTIAYAESIYFQKFSLDGDTIISDQRGTDQGFITVDTEDSTHPWTGTSLSTNFSCFPSGYTQSSDFAINGVFDYTQYQSSCFGLYDYYDSLLQEFEAATVLAYYGLNIQPSVHHLLNCHPTKSKLITDSDPNPNAETIPTGCNLDYTMFSNIKGITPVTCYGASGQIGTGCNAKCQNGIDDVVTYGSSLRMGMATGDPGVPEAYLRRMIARFGPVLGYNNGTSAKRWQVYYGWHLNSTSNYPFYQSITRNGVGPITMNNEASNVFFNITTLVFFTGERQVLTPYNPSVQCTTGKFPSTDGCVCADTDTVCKAGPVVDCTKTPTDAACAEDCEDNTKKTITECACVVGDKRDACKEAGKDASGTIRIALSVIAAAVVLPMFALFC